MNSTPGPKQTPSDETLRMEYGEVCKSHSSITEFRAKLLALLPIASGSGIFLLLTKRSEPIDTTYLHFIGLFGFLVTLGLFIYELRGIQHCKRLNQVASHLEEQLHLREAQFIGRPKARLGGLLGAEGAAYIIYPTMLAAWIFVAFVGFKSHEQKGLVVLPNGGSTFSGPQGREADLTEILAANEQTGGGLGLFRQIIAPRSGPPVHIHRTNDEFFYVVSGEFNFKLADRIVSVPARSIVFVPRGTAHTFKNVGTEPGVLLVGVTPGGLEKMFAERQGVDSATEHALMKKHSMEEVGPPLP